MKTRHIIAAALAVATLTACDLRPKPGITIIAPEFRPNAELLQAAEQAKAQPPPAPWLIIERHELAPARPTIVGGLTATGESALPPANVTLHSAVMPTIKREGEAWKITFSE